MSNGTVLILSAPSGCGKDTIASKLASEDSNYKISVSMTTRAMRPGDIDGETYNFVDKETFEKMIGNDEFFEYAKYNDNYYGTPREPVTTWLNQGKTVIFVIEVQGAQKMREIFPGAISIFILPPSMGTLEERLRNRHTETDDQIKGRLDIAYKEIARSFEFKYIVMNDVLEDAVEDIKCIVRSQKYKSEKMKYCVDEVLKNG